MKKKCFIYSLLVRLVDDDDVQQKNVRDLSTINYK